MIAASTCHGARASSAAWLIISSQGATPSVPPTLAVLESLGSQARPGPLRLRPVFFLLDFAEASPGARCILGSELASNSNAATTSTAGVRLRWSVFTRQHIPRRADGQRRSPDRLRQRLTTAGRSARSGVQLRAGGQAPLG